MSLTRAMLKGMGLTEEQVSAIIEEHTSVTGALKEDIKKYKEDADKLADVQKKYDDLKEEYDKYKEDSNEDQWEAKYNDEHKAFEDYKAEIAGKEQTAKVREAYKKLLAECNVGEKQVESILKVTDFKDLKLKEDGSFEDVEALKKGITEEWSGFIKSTEVRGADVSNPPGGSGNPDEGNSGRAKQLAAKYHENLYGKSKEV